MTAPLRSADTELDVRARVRAAPPLEPPYDDEATASGSDEAPRLRVVRGMARPDELPFGPERASLRLAERYLDDDEHDPLFGPQPTPRDELPDPREHGRRLVKAVLEVIARRRPLQQLLPWTNETVYEELTAWMYRTDRVRTLRQSPPPALRSVRVSEPADGVAEITAVVFQETRVRAVALRLEGADGRWRCTLLRML